MARWFLEQNFYKGKRSQSLTSNNFGKLGHEFALSIATAKSASQANFKS